MNPIATDSRPRPFLRWLAPGLLGLCLATCWVLFFSGGFRAIVGWIFLITLGQTLGPLTIVIVLVQALRKRRLSRPMTVALGLALVALWPALWAFGILPIAFPASLEKTIPAATVRLPSDSPLRVVWGGDRLATNQHALTPDQRWAYDLVVEPAASGSARLEDYGCFGTPVLAPVAARVHEASDGMRDATPGDGTNITQPLGNHVVLALEGGTFLLLAHMKQGSVLVRPGDTVQEGQPLGACGNSGNTSEPHIHIHHQRQDPKVFPVNFAEGLPLYFRDHDGAAMPEGGVTMQGGRAAFTGAVVRHREAGGQTP